MAAGAANQGDVTSTRTRMAAGAANQGDVTSTRARMAAGAANQGDVTSTRARMAAATHCVWTSWSEHAFPASQGNPSAGLTTRVEELWNRLSDGLCTGRTRYGGYTST